MKRVPVIAALLVLAVLAVLPWLAGRQARAHYEGLLAQMERQGARVLSHRYRQGWFDSEAVTELELRPSNGAAPWPVRAQSRILHGPLRGGWEPLWARVFTRFSAPTAGSVHGMPLQMDARVRLDGGVAAALRMPDQEAAGFKVRGFHGRFRVDGGTGSVQGELRIPLLDLEEADHSAFRVQDLDLAVDMAPGVAGMQLGELTFALAALRLEAPGAEAPLALRGLRVEARTRAEGELLFVDLGYRATGLHAGEEGVSDADLRIVLERLPAPVLVHMRESLQGLQGGSMPEAQRSLAALGVLSGNLQQLLAHKPRFGVERLHLTTSQGAVDGHLMLRVGDLPQGALPSPMLLAGYLEGDAELAVPETLLRTLLHRQMRAAVNLELVKRRAQDPDAPVADEAQLEARIDREVERQIGRLLDQQLAVREEGLILSRARLGSGLLTVNGKTVPLPFLGAGP